MLARKPPAMRWPLDALDAALPGIGYEGLVRLGVARAEGDIAHGAAFGVRRALEEVAIVDGAVEQVGLCSVALRMATSRRSARSSGRPCRTGRCQRCWACCTWNPFRLGRAYPGRWGICRPAPAVCDEVLTHDHHGHSRGSRVFLRAGEQQAVALDVERTG